MRNETPQRAEALFESGYYCAESVLVAMAEALGVDCEAIPRLATGLCSGIARSCGTCGAVLGAILAVGLALGRDRAEDSVEPAYTAVNAVTEAFLARYGSANCLELTGCDLGTDKGQTWFHEKRQHETCGEYVETATRLALDAIARQEGGA
ncbi:C-GCAxxG-C-C family protein [Candidatus Bipolaricaulota bacterium]|nr:C-GCAxxG-C-C family protein [Candidatus Bipolaricaulota bacterium]